MKTWHKAAIAVILVLGVLVCIKSCVDKENPDIIMAYIGDGFIDRNAFEENKEEIENVCRDINNDGKRVVDIMEISFNESLSQSDFQNSQQKLASALGAGLARVYFIEERYLNANINAGLFADISEPGKGIEGENGVAAVNIKGNDKAKKLGINTEKDIYLAVRAVSEMDKVLDSNIDEKNNLAMKIAEYILN